MNQSINHFYSDLTESSGPLVMASSQSLEEDGVRINRVNLYAFGGIGNMLQLKLTVKKDGCKTGRT